MSEAAERWSDQLDRVADPTLIALTDSWHMAANISGKGRQLLNHPMSDLHLAELASSAASKLCGVRPGLTA